MKLEILTPEQRQVCYKSHLSGPTEQEGDLLTVIGELTNLVDVERARRIKAEELLREAEPWLSDSNPLWDAKEPGTLERLHERIVAALAQYPRVEDGK